MSYKKISEELNEETQVYAFQETFRGLARKHNDEYNELSDNVALTCKEYNIPIGNILVRLRDEYKNSLNMKEE